MGWLFDPIRWLANQFLILVWNALQTVFEWGYHVLMGLLSLVGIPPIVFPDFDAWLNNHGFWPIVAAANDWLPVSEFFAAVAAYCLLLIVLAPIKFVLHHIPSMGGGS